MAKHSDKSEVIPSKRVKWSHGSGGKWHYSEESETYTKVWKSWYNGVWVDSSGWAHNVVWYLAELIWAEDGDVWDNWQWDYA